MGDYQQLIRPASAFWSLPDGLTMAEKIMFYRNWKSQVNESTGLYRPAAARLVRLCTWSIFVPFPPLAQRCGNASHFCPPATRRGI